MFRGAARALMVVTLLCAALAGGSRPLRAAPAPSTLVQALAMAPAGDEVFFTDWDLLRRYEGVPTLSSKSSLDARLRFMRSLGGNQALASSYGINYFALHASNWSWDSTDLLWEMTLSSPSASPAFVLAFRPQFDLRPVVAHLTQRGFTRANYHGVPIYSHALDLSASWTTTTELAIRNTAVLADRRMLVLSSFPERVRAVLDAARRAAPALDGDGAARDAAATLGTAAAAVVSPGQRACEAFGTASMLVAPAAAGATTRALLVAERAQLSKAHRYSAMALGYRDQGSPRPLGLLALHYADAATARADLAPRRTLADSGLSLVTLQPYRSMVFTLDSATVHGSDLVLQMRPRGDRPQLLFEMVLRRDMTFAACP